MVAVTSKNKCLGSKPQCELQQSPPVINRGAVQCTTSIKTVQQSLAVAQY